jgi:hypothetical protein
VQRLVGHKLFTLLVVVEGDAEVERIYSSNAVAYPLTGRKPMRSNALGRACDQGSPAVAWPDD